MNGPQRNERSRQARGYDAEHDRQRQRWARIVASGAALCANPVCLQPTRHIAPDEPWDLGHNEDRTGWRGAEHQLCNRSEGGRKSPANTYVPGRMTIRKWGER